MDNKFQIYPSHSSHAIYLFVGFAHLEQFNLEH